MLGLRFRPLLAVCALAATLALVVSNAEARPGGGGSFGSQIRVFSGMSGDSWSSLGCSNGSLGRAGESPQLQTLWNRWKLQQQCS